MEEFISDCNKAITTFKTLRDQVEKNVEIIDQVVKAIGEAQLVRTLEWNQEEPFNIQVSCHVQAPRSGMFVLYPSGLTVHTLGIRTHLLSLSDLKWAQQARHLVILRG